MICERVTTLPAKPVCLAGLFEDSRNACCNEIIHDKVVVCPGGGEIGPDGLTCMKQVKFLADHVCPAPFEVACGSKGKKKSARVAHPSHCECVNYHYAEPVPVCPEGELFEDGMCVVVKPSEPYCPEYDAILMDGMCHRTVTEPARLEYTVTYVTEQPCEHPSACVEQRIPVMKKKIHHKAVHITKKGKTKTICHETKCIDKDGNHVVEGFQHDEADVEEDL